MPFLTLKNSLMKILVCHNAYQLKGGEDQVVAAETELLKLKGHEVVTWLVTNDVIQGAVSKLKAGFQAAYNKESYRQMQGLLDQHQPDLVHVHNFFPLLSPAIYDAVQEAGIPIVQTLHNYRLFCANGLMLRDNKPCEICLTQSPLNGIKYSCYRDSKVQSAAVVNMIWQHRRKQTFLKKVNRFIVLSTFSKKKFEAYGLPPDKLSIKGNFLIDNLPQQAVSRNNNVLFVGRLSEEKGVHILTEVAKAMPEAQFDVVGNGPLAHLFSTLPNVVSHGRLSREDVLAQMQRASVLLMPSTCYENAPLVLLEAMSCGLPVIAHDIGALAEHIEHEENGLKVPVGDIESISDAISRLLTDAVYWQKISRQGISYAKQHFSPEANYQQLLTIYQEAIQDYA